MNGLDKKLIDFLVSELCGQLIDSRLVMQERLSNILQNQPPESVESFQNFMINASKVIHNQYVLPRHLDERTQKLLFSASAEEVLLLYKAYTNHDTATFTKKFLEKSLRIAEPLIVDAIRATKIQNITQRQEYVKENYPLLPTNAIDELGKITSNGSFLNYCCGSILPKIKKQLPDFINQTVELIDIPDTQKNQQYMAIVATIIETVFVGTIDQKTMDAMIQDEIKIMIDSNAPENEKKAISEYLSRSFFAKNNKRYYGGDAVITQYMDEQILDIHKKYPNLSSSIRHKYKNKSWYESMAQRYIAHYLNSREKNIKKGTLLKNEKLDTIDEKNHRTLFHVFLSDEMTKLCKQEHEKREKQDAQKHPPQTIKQSKPQENQSMKSSQDCIVDKELEEKLENAIKQLRKSSHDTLDKVVDTIKPYILSRKQQGLGIRIRYIKNKLGKLFTKEVHTFIEKLCNDLDMPIVEIENALRELHDAQVQSPRKQKQSKPSSEEITDTSSHSAPKIYSATLAEIQDTPEKLTTEKLIIICKELGYRFSDEKEFSREANAMGLNASGNEALDLKVKIIGALRIGAEHGWAGRKTAKGSPNYQRLDLNHGRRLVKQGKTIIWIIKDWDEYRNRINTYFVSKKINFDDIVEINTPIDPKAA